MDFYVQSIVARGIQILDKKYPGWENQINLDNLDIQFDNKCVLAQLYGSHASGLSTLGIRKGGDEYFGFAHNRYDDSKSSEQYSTLNTEWKRVISEMFA